MPKSPVETPKRTGSARPHKIFLFPHATSDIKGITMVTAEQLRGSTCLGHPFVSSDAGAILWKVIRYHHSFINSVFLVSL